jgi:hypothetical protein
VHEQLAAQAKATGKRLPRKTSNTYKQLFAETALALGFVNLSPPGGSDPTLPSAGGKTQEETKAGHDAHGLPFGKRPRE